MDNLNTPPSPQYVPPFTIFAPWCFRALLLPDTYQRGRMYALRLLCLVTVRPQVCVFMYFLIYDAGQLIEIEFQIQIFIETNYCFLRIFLMVSLNVNHFLLFSENQSENIFWGETRIFLNFVGYQVKKMANCSQSEKRLSFLMLTLYILQDTPLPRTHLIQFYKVLHQGLCCGDPDTVHTLVRFTGSRYFL